MTSYEYRVGENAGLSAIPFGMYAKIFVVAAVVFTTTDRLASEESTDASGGGGDGGGGAGARPTGGGATYVSGFDIRDPGGQDP